MNQKKTYILVYLCLFSLMFNNIIAYAETPNSSAIYERKQLLLISRKATPFYAFLGSAF